MTDAKTDIGETLHLEHLHTLAFTNALEARVSDRNRPLNPADAADAALIDDLIAVVDADIHRHFQFEEEVLFPRVNDAGLSEVTAMLVEEHDMIRTMADELRSLALSARNAGPDPAQWAEFRGVAMDFIHAEMFHIQKEEMGVIRSLSVILSADATRELAAQYAALNSDASAGP
jgi:hemerythrin-like domain-containing protein